MENLFADLHLHSSFSDGSFSPQELVIEAKKLVTGGSDCHVGGKGKKVLGNIKIPYGLVEKLKERRMVRFGT